MPSRVVVLGRSGVGKTCLMLRISRDKFPSYVPRMDFECSATFQSDDGGIHAIDFFEPDGNGSERVQHEVYPHAEVVLICFATNDRRSFEEVRSVWMPQVIQWCRSAPVLLVSTKSDLEDELENNKNGKMIVSDSESKSLEKELYFEGYYKCSAVTGDGIRNLCQHIFNVSKSQTKMYKNVSIYVEGNKGVGKTSLISGLAGDATKQTNPDISKQNDTSCIWTRKNGKLVRVAIFDGLNHGWRRRSIDISKACAILLCYSVDCRSSFANIIDSWAPTLRRDFPDVPLFLVATKVDQRENAKMHEFLKRNKISFVTKMEGLTLAKKIGAIKYMECSSTTESGIKLLMDKVVNKSIKLKKKRKLIEHLTTSV